MIDIADPIRSTDASARTSLAALGVIGLAMVSLTAIGLRIQDPYWNTFVLLLVLHGFLTIAATKVAERVPRAFGLALVAVIALGAWAAVRCGSGSVREHPRNERADCRSAVRTR